MDINPLAVQALYDFNERMAEERKKKTMTRAFYMVYGEGGRAPAVRHQSRAAAVTEATRLAANNPGQKFYVLQALEVLETNAVTRTELV